MPPSPRNTNAPARQMHAQVGINAQATCDSRGFNQMLAHGLRSARAYAHRVFYPPIHLPTYPGGMSKTWRMCCCAGTVGLDESILQSRAAVVVTGRPLSACSASHSQPTPSPALLLRHHREWVKPRCGETHAYALTRKPAQVCTSQPELSLGTKNILKNR